MKTRNFLLLVIGLFFAVNISAKKPETTTLSNVEVTASGTIKELTTFATETDEPMQRSVYKYDLSGNILEKITYKWAGSKGWEGLQKMEYSYNEENTDKPVSLTFAKWNTKNNDWSKDVKVVRYEYDEDGKAIITTTEN